MQEALERIKTRELQLQIKTDENEKLGYALREAAEGGESAILERNVLRREVDDLKQKYERVMMQRAQEQYGEALNLIGLGPQGGGLLGQALDETVDVSFNKNAGGEEMIKVNANDGFQLGTVEKMTLDNPPPESGEYDV